MIVSHLLVFAPRPSWSAPTRWAPPAAPSPHPEPVLDAVQVLWTIQNPRHGPLWCRESFWLMFHSVTFRRTITIVQNISHLSSSASKGVVGHQTGWRCSAPQASVTSSVFSIARLLQTSWYSSPPAAGGPHWLPVDSPCLPAEEELSKVQVSCSFMGSQRTFRNQRTLMLI